MQSAERNKKKKREEWNTINLKKSLKINNMATQKPPKSIRFPDDVQEAIEKKAKQWQRSFQWIVIEGMRKQLIDKKNKKV